MKNWLGIILIISFLASYANGEDLRAIYQSRRAGDLIVQEKPLQAHRLWLEAVELAPLSPVTHYNLGLSFLAIEDFDKADREFQLSDALARQNPEIKYWSRFNRAIVAQMRKDIDMALARYQDALEIRPDSVEVKTNIELLTKQEGQGGSSQDQKNDKESNEGKPQDKDKKDDNKNQEQQNKGQQQEKRPQPKEFKSKELTEQQVKTILEELKRQEQSIRSKMEEKQIKERSNGKDW